MMDPSTSKGVPMIIVEGPDGSGKTTLVGQIEEQWKLTREPRAVSKDAKALTPVDRYIERELEKGFGLRLYDRFAMISSPCYAMLPDRTFSGDMFDPTWLRLTWAQFYRINPVVIVCLPSMDTVKGNTRVGKHDGVNLENDIETIYIQYLSWFAGQVHNTSVMRWDYHNPDPVRLNNLIQWAHARVEKEHG